MMTSAAAAEAVFVFDDADHHALADALVNASLPYSLLAFTEFGVKLVHETVGDWSVRRA